MIESGGVKMQRIDDENISINIEQLPVEAKKELFDFYKSLIRKYGTKKQAVLPKGFYNPIKVESWSKIAKREEIYER